MAGISRSLSGHGQTALLLKDTHGDKIGAWYPGYRKKKDQRVLRGTILQPIAVKDSGMSPDGKPVVNYKVYNEDVMLYCDGLDVVPLTNHEFSLVIGIREREARFNVFVNDALDWGVKLKAGQAVFVTLPSKLGLSTPHHSCQAVIRWIGALPGEEGLKFGVEITDERCYGAGSTDGYFHGNQLFHCRKDNGLFVDLDKLAPCTDHAGEKRQTMPSSLLAKNQSQNPNSRLRLKANGDPKPNESNLGGPAAGLRSRKSEPTSKFKISDSVVIYNKQQHPIHGTVKWLGTAYADTGRVNIVGIEINVSVSKDEFECSLTGYSSNFKCSDPRHSKVVLPEGLVQTRAEANSQKERSKAQAHGQEHKAIDQHEEQMLRNAKIESLAMNPQEQAKLMQEYKDQDKNAPSSIFPGRGSGQVGPSSSQRNKHLYDLIPGLRSPLTRHGHHSSSTGNLQRYNSTPNPGTGSMTGVEDELRRAYIETKAFNTDEQARMLADYKKQQKQDEERKRDPYGYPAATRFDSPVDDPLKQPPNTSNNQSRPANVPSNKPFVPEGPVYRFQMNSKVEFSNLPRYGVIRWMGDLPEVAGMVAGVELEEPYEGCSDGTRGGKHYFNCKPGHAFFCPVTTLRPDRREAAASNTNQTVGNPRQITPFPDGSDEKTTMDYDKLLSTKDDEIAALKRQVEIVKKVSIQHREEAAAYRADNARLNNELEHATTTFKAEIALLRKELEGKTEELAAHSADAWKIPPERTKAIKSIGMGGWGEVLKGTVEVAMKRINHPMLVSPKNIDRFVREMKLLAEVRHPNLVQFIGAVFDQSPPVIVTELLDMNLRQAYENNRLQPGDRLSIFKDVAAALKYLHQRFKPIIHRDVSAPNVLLLRDPKNRWIAKVSDLGSANFLEDAKTAAEGAVLYSPPECVPQSIDLRAKPLPQSVKIDVYSYGILLCEVSTSQMPKPEHFWRMIGRVEAENPSMYRLIDSCTKRDPSERPTMAAVLESLEQMP